MTIFQYTAHTIKPITIAAKLGSGGEGTVYAVEGNPDICVKIYHEQKRTPELEAKLKAMIDAPPKDPTLAAGHYSICWPTDVVYEDEACTKFLGFIMPRIDRNIFKEYHLLCDKPGATTSTCYRLEHFGTGFTYLHMYVVALNLASCVASIHAVGHAIGDLNDKNILVSTKDSKITIVDCDSFEIHAKNHNVFPCSVYMPEYSSPEVIQRKAIKNRQASDRFALSILIFKLLMLNTHPYASRGSSVEHLNTPGEKIAQGYYPYEEYADLDVNPPAYALPYDIIPPNIKALFRRCFVEGQHEPEKRPSAMEWFVAIKENYEAMTAKMQNKLVMCGNNARHFFPLHLTTCPWCAMPEDYFPMVIKKVDKKAQTRVLDNFTYISKMLDSFMKDDILSIPEQYELNREIKKRNLSEDEINVFYNEYEKRNPSVIIGKKPTYKQKNFFFMGLYPTDSPKETICSIKNNYIISDLSISIRCDHPAIDIQPLLAQILPGDKVDVCIKFDPSKILGTTKLNDTIEIMITEIVRAKSKFEILTLTYKIFHENILYVILRFLFSNRLLLLLVSIINYGIFWLFFSHNLSKGVNLIITIFSLIFMSILLSNKLEKDYSKSNNNSEELSSIDVASSIYLAIFPIVLILFYKLIQSYSTTTSSLVIFSMVSIVISMLFYNKIPDMRADLKRFIILIVFYIITTWIMLIFI